MQRGEQDVLDELETAIRAWDSQVTAAQLDLSVQMAGLQEQLSVLFMQSASKRAGKPSPAATGTPNGGRVQELESLLHSERDRVLELEAWLRSSRTEDAAADPGLAAALRDRDEAHRTIVSLRAEIDLLRRANAGLRLRDQRPSDSAAEPTVAAPTPESIEVYDEQGRKRRMGEILVELGAITEDQLAASLDEQAAGPHRRLGAMLVEKGFVTEELVARVLAGQLDLPFVRLPGDVVDEGAPRVIGAALARRRMCIPVTVTPDRVVLAMANPCDLIAIEDVELASHRRVEAVVATPSDVEASLSFFYGAS